MGRQWREEEQTIANQATGSLNRFDKGKQLSLLGMANNVNEQGFSTSDFQSFTGQGGGNQGGGLINTGRQSGIMTNSAGGINFNRDLSSKTQLMSNYFYNHLDLNIQGRLIASIIFRMTAAISMTKTQDS
ncbi:MAG: hypothetical protein WDN75_00255 [Bacteroidota bacterium]